MNIVTRTLKLCLITIALAGASCATAPRTNVADGTRTTLALLESTDVHSNVLSYDYYQLSEDMSLGFERLATLIGEARQQYPNSMLFDAGDTIQGTALADLQARAQPLPCEQELAMYKAMDVLGYDAGTIGNGRDDWQALSWPGLPAGLVQRVRREVREALVCAIPCSGSLARRHSC